MKHKLLYWSPRILSLLFVAFLSLFALDVFGAYEGWALVLALFMHLLAPLIVLAAAIIAWKRELFGAIVFIFFALYYVWAVGVHMHWSIYVTIAGPAALISILYFVSWLQKRK